ncbi:hypothetical protein V8F33_003295 [Rhypophila sp. PSN 637]
MVTQSTLSGHCPSHNHNHSPPKSCEPVIGYASLTRGSGDARSSIPLAGAAPRSADGTEEPINSRECPHSFSRVDQLANILAMLMLPWLSIISPEFAPAQSPVTVLTTIMSAIAGDLGSAGSHSSIFPHRGQVWTGVLEARLRLVGAMLPLHRVLPRLEWPLHPPVTGITPALCSRNSTKKFKVNLRQRACLKSSWMMKPFPPSVVVTLTDCRTTSHRGQQSGRAQNIRSVTVKKTIS